MGPDDEICLCFHVTKRKVMNFCRREQPVKASLVSECLGAGTGCGWCVPFLQRLWENVRDGRAEIDEPDPEAYRAMRVHFRESGLRPETPPDTDAAASNDNA